MISTWLAPLGVALLAAYSTWLVSINSRAIWRAHANRRRRDSLAGHA